MTRRQWSVLAVIGWLAVSGVFVFAAFAHATEDLSYLDRSGPLSSKTHGLKKLAYDAGGRAGVVGLDIALVMLGLLFAAGHLRRIHTGRKSAATPGAAEDMLRDALRCLLRSEEEGTFLVAENLPSGKFVQFVGSASEPLIVDVPTQMLTRDEEGRVSSLFESLGGGRTRSVLVDRAGRSAGTQESYQLDCGRNVERATQCALRVFREVYGMPPGVALAVSGSAVE